MMQIVIFGRNQRFSMINARLKQMKENNLYRAEMGAISALVNA